MPNIPQNAAHAAQKEGTVRLQRALKLPSLIIFGLSYLAPLIVMGTFGVISGVTQGGTAGAYVVALCAMLFTANSYCCMSAEFPVAGSAYTYVRKTIDSRVGFLVGWATLLDYMFLPMVIWLIGASYLKAQFPTVPIAVWVLAFIILTTALNIIGIKVADKANFALMTFQILVIAFFVILSFVTIGKEGGAFVSMQPFLGETGNINVLASGAAIAAYSFLGFDAVSTLTEEAVNPKRDMPRAIFLVALLGGGIFVVVSYAVQLVHPGGVFDNADAAGSEIAMHIGGNLFAAVFLAALVVAQFNSGIAAQAAGSRLLYAMGRDGVLPKEIFGHLSPKFRTPIFGIIFVAIVGLLALVMDMATSTSFINFGAFIGFMFVNASAIAHWYKQRKVGRKLHPLIYVVFPAIGACVIAYLITQLDIHAIILGTSWFVIGILVLAHVTKGFKIAPPEFDEE